MRFLYGKQDMRTLDRAQETSFLLTNGLGGYASMTAAFSANRADMGILVAAVKAPNERITLVHRLRETLSTGGQEHFLSTQPFAGDTKPEEGYRHISDFTYDYLPAWTYQLSGVRVRRALAMGWETNTAAVLYTVENRSGKPCTLRVDPFLKFAPKEAALKEEKEFAYTPGTVRSGAYTLYLRTDGREEALPTCWQTLAYPEDVKDGRPGKGMAGACCTVTKTVAPGAAETFEIVFSTRSDCPGAEEIIRQQQARLSALAEGVRFYKRLLINYPG